MPSLHGDLLVEAYVCFGQFDVVSSSTVNPMVCPATNAVAVNKHVTWNNRLSMRNRFNVINATGNNNCSALDRSCSGGPF